MASWLRSCERSIACRLLFPWQMYSGGMLRMPLSVTSDFKYGAVV
jgi:hypothetical protein